MLSMRLNICFHGAAAILFFCCFWALGDAPFGTLTGDGAEASDGAEANENLTVGGLTTCTPRDELSFAGNATCSHSELELEL